VGCFSDLSIRLLQIIEFDNRNLIGTLNGSCPIILHLPTDFAELYFYFFLSKRRIDVSTNQIASRCNVTYAVSGGCYLPPLTS